MATHRIEELHPALETIKDVANTLGIFL